MPTTSAIVSAEFRTLRVALDGHCATVTIDNPPVNLLDGAMVEDLVGLLELLRADREVRVVVFNSADQDFFVGHSDLDQFLGPRDVVPERAPVLTGLQAVFENLRTLPQATIGVIEGRAVGGGLELATSLDMTFAGRGRAVLELFEVAVGVVPGATGSQRLPQMLGRRRALETILGCQELDADLASEYGLVNRALDSETLRPFVDRLARRIASFPPAAVAAAKRTVDAASPSPVEGLLAETRANDHLLVNGEPQRRMAALLERGAEGREFELTGFAGALETLGES